MKREWYAYCPTTRRTSAHQLRAELPADVRGRLISDAPLNWGVAAEKDDVELIRRLDDILQIGRSRSTIRYSMAEVDQDSLYECTHFLGLVNVARATSKEQMEPESALSLMDYARCIDIRWPRGVMNGIRYLVHPLLHDIGLVMPNSTHEVLRHQVGGLRFAELDGGLWLAEFVHRARCRGDAIAVNDEGESGERYVADPYVFGLRYCEEDIGPSDALLVDRIRIGEKECLYSVPKPAYRLAFVKACLQNSIDGIVGETSCFDRGFLPLPVSGERVSV